MAGSSDGASVGDEIRSRIDEAAAGRGGRTGAGRPGRRRQVRTARPGRRRRRADRASARGAAPPQRSRALALRTGARSARRPVPPHPALLDGLDDGYRAEIERALSGRASCTGRASPGTSGCSSPPPSWCASLPATTGCCWSSTTCTRPTRPPLRLLHYLCRCADDRAGPGRVAHRPLADHAGARSWTAWWRRSSVAGSRCSRSPTAPYARLLEAEQPDLTRGRADTIVHRSARESRSPRSSWPAARRRRHARAAAGAPRATCTATFRRVALLGTTFTTDELLALCRGRRGVGLPPAPRRRVRAAGRARRRRGHRFRHPLLREALVEQLPPLERLVGTADRGGAARRAWARRRARSPTSSSPRDSPPAPCRTCSARSSRRARSAPTATHSPSSTASRQHAGTRSAAAAAGPAWQTC